MPWTTPGCARKIGGVKICFVETESLEEEFFRDALGDEHELTFAGDLSEVPQESDALSVFIHSKVTAEYMKSRPALRLIATRSTGFDHIDCHAALRQGITICYVATYGENTVAEHSFALLLAISRRLRESLQAHSSGHFSYQALRGFDLKGKTLGIIGTGRIGLHTVRIARGFDMEVLAFDLQTQPLVAATLGFEYVPFEELLRRADVISLHIPLLPETQHILNRKTLALCKHGVVLINTARGGLVDTAALLEALESGQVGAAGLDVLEDERVLQQDGTRIIGGEIVSRLQAASQVHEQRIQRPERVEQLRSLVSNSKIVARSNVVFTPHSAFNSAEAVDRINQETVRSIRRFTEGKPVNIAPCDPATAPPHPAPGAP